MMQAPGSHSVVLGCYGAGTVTELVAEMLLTGHTVSLVVMMQTTTS